MSLLPHQQGDYHKNMNGEYLSTRGQQLDDEGRSEQTPQATLRICFVSHKAYPALIGSATGHIGGAERQACLMALWLAARGHQVSLVTWD